MKYFRICLLHGQSVNDARLRAKSSKNEGRKATTQAVESINEGKKLNAFDHKIFLCGNLWKETLIKWYISCSVLFGLSFNGKNMNVNKISYAKTRGMKWLVRAHQLQF